MKSFHSTLGALLLLPAGLLLATTTSPRATATQSAQSNAAGTYFFETVTQSNGLAVNGFITLHRDGTTTWADQSDFGIGGFFNSTAHGVWRKTGADEVTIDGYYYRFDLSGTPIALVRIRTVGSLTSGQGVGTVDVFGPTQNPVTEAPALPDADVVTLSTYRVQ